MGEYDIYVLILCLIVFIALTAVFVIGIVYIAKLLMRLIKTGAEDEKLKTEYQKSQIKTKGTKILSVIDKVFSAFLCFIVVMVFAFSIIVNVNENKVTGAIPTMQVVKSGSMSYINENNENVYGKQGVKHSIQTFDIILTYQLPEEKDLKLYDIVVYEVEDQLIVHRIVGIEEPNQDHSERYFLLQGDAVERPDRFPVRYKQMKGIYKGDRIPFIGSFITFMQSPAGWLCIILLLLAFIATPVLDKKFIKVKRARLIEIGFINEKGEIVVKPTTDTTTTTTDTTTTTTDTTTTTTDTTTTSDNDTTTNTTTDVVTVADTTTDDTTTTTTDVVTTADTTTTDTTTTTDVVTNSDTTTDDTTTVEDETVTTTLDTTDVVTVAYVTTVDDTTTTTTDDTTTTTTVDLVTTVEEEKITTTTDTDVVIVEEDVTSEIDVDTDVECDVVTKNTLFEKLSTLNRNSLTFKQKLKNAPIQTVQRYNEIIQYLYRIKDVCVIDSKNFETYKKGRIPLAKITIKGKTLNVYIGLDPTEYQNSKYVYTDVSNVKAHKLYGMRVKVTSDRQVKWVKELLSIIAEKNGLFVYAIAKLNIKRSGLTYKQRLHLLNSEVKQRYNDIIKHVYKIKDVRRIDSKKSETYKKGRVSVIKLTIKGKTLNAYIGLQPSDYAQTKYVYTDVSSVKAYKSLPMRVKITSDRQAKWTKELIDEVASKNNLFMYAISKLTVIKSSNKTLKQRLSEAPEQTKEWFNKISEYLEDIPRVTVRETDKQITYKVGMHSIAKLKIIGKTINLYLNLEPSKYKNTKYKFIDVSSKKAHRLYPMRMKITSERKVKWAIELIDDIL